MRAAAMKDAGMKTTQGVVDGQALRQRKWRCAAPNESVQIHGGYGFIKDYPAEKFLSRREAVPPSGEGTSENPAAGDRAAAC